MAVEDNMSMLQSYLMINPQGRFYQNGATRKGYRLSRPIAEVVVAAAPRLAFDYDEVSQSHQGNTISPVVL